MCDALRINSVNACIFIHVQDGYLFYKFLIIYLI